MSATTLYQIGQTMLGRRDSELDRSAARRRLATIAGVLHTRGTEALSLRQVRDDFVHYGAADSMTDASLAEAGLTFSWVTLRATNPRSGTEIASLAVGYEG